MTKTYFLRQNDLWVETSSHLSNKMKKIVDDKVINNIKLKPYNSEYLRLDLEGLRSYNKLKSGYRIIFAICEECRKNSFEEANNCMDCDNIDDNTIMLFAVGEHDIYNDLERKRKKLIKRVRRKKKKS